MPAFLNLLGRQAAQRHAFCRKFGELNLPPPSFAKRLVQGHKLRVTMHDRMRTFLESVLGHRQLHLVGSEACTLLLHLRDSNDPALDEGNVAQHLHCVLLPTRQHLPSLLLLCLARCGTLALLHLDASVAALLRHQRRATAASHGTITTDFSRWACNIWESTHRFRLHSNNAHAFARPASARAHAWSRCCFAGCREKVIIDATQSGAHALRTRLCPSRLLLVT
mmetsp:Transcript_14126/g.28439  ORF Transcript_14126/g.28439 Transcript_14126/m.28439 type:complete len:223 (+) Transcript_14126:591-1259(+)